MNRSLQPFITLMTENDSVDVVSVKGESFDKVAHNLK